MSSQPFVLMRPVRTTGLLWAGLVALIAVCAPFIEDVNLVTFVLVGVPYSFLVAVFGVGLGLTLPSRLAPWWIISAGVLVLLVMSGIWLVVRFDPESIVSAPPALFRGLLGLLLAWILAGCVIAGWGWVRHFLSRGSIRHA